MTKTTNKTQNRTYITFIKKKKIGQNNNITQFTLNSLLSFILSCALILSPDFGRPSNAILSSSVKSSGAFASAAVTAFANSSVHTCGNGRNISCKIGFCLFCVLYFNNNFVKIKENVVCN